MTLLYIVIATSIISLVSLIGVLIIFSRQINSSFLKSLISLAAGSMLAVSFLDLLPEAIEIGIFQPPTILGVSLISILFFFLFERVLHWHHCRCQDCSKDSEDRAHLVYLNLTGDATHNLIDGFLVASTFMLDFRIGIITTLAIILHEIPQEIADFGVLLYAGLNKARALIYNLFTATTAILGALIFYFFGQQFELLVPLMAAFAAGNFIYLASADIIPELEHESQPQKIVLHSLWLIIGVIIIFSLERILPHV